MDVVTLGQAKTASKKHGDYAYARDSIFIPATAMSTVSGTATAAVLGRRGGVTLPSGATTILYALQQIPDHWTGFDASVVFTRTGTGGSVVLRLDASDASEGDNIFNNPTAGTSLTISVPAANVQQDRRLVTGGVLSARGRRSLAVNLLRTSGGTSTDTIFVLGVKLTNTGVWHGRKQRHLMVAGQSLAVGVDGDPAISTTADPSGKALTFNGAAFVNETTPDPAVQYVESSLVRAVVAHTGQPTSINTDGQAGAGYSSLARPTTKFLAGVANLDGGNRLLEGGLEVPSIHVIHGETDTSTGGTAASYKGNLRQWMDDYWDLIRQANGQPTSPKLVVCQTSSWDNYVSFPTVTLGQLDAHRAYDDIVLACPKYNLPYASIDATHVHLSNVGYYRLGEYHAKVANAIIDGTTWEPISPAAISITGAVITVDFHVPVGPLVFDTTGDVASQTNKGFAFTDSTTSATISSVAITGPAQVKVTLSNAPTGATPKLSYACTTRYGNLRDSDPAVSVYDGHNLYNWCVAFNDPIPYTGP